jgi:hypothetical protein
MLKTLRNHNAACKRSAHSLAIVFSRFEFCILEIRICLGFRNWDFGFMPEAHCVSGILVCFIPICPNPHLHYQWNF